jgi:rubrerythrin
MADDEQRQPDDETQAVAIDLDAGTMACPVCGHAMPDLRGGKASICPICGFKDSCCY